MKTEDFQLLLLDIKLKNENGLELCKMLKTQGTKMKILMLSSYHGEDYIINAYNNEADGYLFKEANNSEIRLALDTILIQNNNYFDYETMQVIFNRQKIINERSKNSKIYLSEIEIKVALYICDGKSTKEISKIMNLGSSTINTHRLRIWKKLGIHKNTELIGYMITNGYFIPKNTRE